MTDDPKKADTDEEWIPVDPPSDIPEPTSADVAAAVNEEVRRLEAERVEHAEQRREPGVGDA